jgi:GAF domain-containing protein
MLYGGNLIGVLSAFEIGDSRRTFNEQDSRLLTLFASQAASAVHNARLLEETRARAEQLATLNEIGRTISSNINIHSVIEALQRQSARAIPFDTFYVALYDSASGRLTYPLYYEAGKRYQESPTVMKRGTYLSRTIETALPLLINRTEQELGSAAKPFNALGDTSRKSASLMFAPMVYGSHAIGVVSAQSYNLNAYSEEHLGMLGAIANQAAIAIQNARLFEQTKQRADEFAALYDVSRDIATQQDITSLMQTIVDRACVLLGAAGGSIGIYDPERDDLLIAAAKDFAASVGMRLKIGEGIVGRVAASRQPIIVQDYRHWEHRLPQYEETQPISAVMAVPILYGGDLFGVVTVYQSDPAAKSFTEADAHLLSLLASQAAGPLHNTRLLEETKRRAEQLSTLNEIGKAVSSQLDVDQTLEEIYRQVKRILPVDAFYVALYNHDRNEVSYPLFYDEGKRYNERSGEPLEGTRLDETIRTGKSILINHTAESYAADHQTTMLGKTSRVSASLMFAPLRSGALVIGAISTQSYSFNAYTEEHLNLFNGIANQAAIAIENARLFADTQRHLQQVQSLHEIDNAISGSLDLRVTFNVFLDKIITQLGVDASNVLLLNHHTQTLEFAASRGFRTPALQHTHLRVGDGLAGRAALDRKIVAVPDLAKDIDSLARSPLIQNEKFLSYYGVPLIAKGRVNGVLEIFQRKYVDRNKEWMDFLASSPDKRHRIDNAA